jgi:aspartyl-tRNA(Asn)/glutamyl-tRNA(Gln) amidotransferase subunit C
MKPEDVRRLARLAALELPAEDDGPPLLDDDDLARYATELTTILAHVERLSTVDVDGVAPTRHGVPLPSVLREDTPTPTLSQAQALAAAPRALDGGFAVPKVVE